MDVGREFHLDISGAMIRYSETPVRQLFSNNTPYRSEMDNISKEATRVSYLKLAEV
jgi:hypothetical protein